MATDYKNGLADEVVIPYGSTDSGPQYRLILRRLSELFEMAGSSLQHQVKVDTYFTTRRHFGTRGVRHQLMPVASPASMALHAQRLVVSGALMAVTPIAVVSNGPPKRSHCRRARCLWQWWDTIRWGDWVFLAGELATDFEHALAPEVETDTRTWFREPVELQTCYILKKLEAILENAGSSLKDVLYVRVAMVDPMDISGMERVWRETWPEHPPARNIIFRE